LLSETTHCLHGRILRGPGLKYFDKYIILKIYYYYYYLIFLTLILNSQGMKKLRCAIEKSTKIKLE